MIRNELMPVFVVGAGAAALFCMAVGLGAMFLAPAEAASHPGGVSQAAGHASYDEDLLVCVEDHGEWQVLADRETRVEYVYRHAEAGDKGFECLSVRMGADGAPVTYAGEL